MLNSKFLLINPAFIFGLFLAVSLLSTYLPWSDLFGELSKETIVIYTAVSLLLIIISLFYHYKLVNYKYFTGGKLLYSFKYKSWDKFIVIFLILFFIFEILYSINGAAISTAISLALLNIIPFLYVRYNYGFYTFNLTFLERGKK